MHTPVVAFRGLICPGGVWLRSHERDVYTEVAGRVCIPVCVCSGPHALSPTQMCPHVFTCLCAPTSPRCGGRPPVLPALSRRLLISAAPQGVGGTHPMGEKQSDGSLFRPGPKGAAKTGERAATSFPAWTRGPHASAQMHSDALSHTRGAQTRPLVRTYTEPRAELPRGQGCSGLNQHRPADRPLNTEPHPIFRT